ncbi:MAG: alpha/beta hydrolase [Elusimicrobiales bacterium]
MTRVIGTLLTIISLSSMPPLLYAGTAFEQGLVSAPGTELAVPLPPVETRSGITASTDPILEKLKLFDYRKSDMLYVTRNHAAAHHGYSVEPIELLIRDPLRQIGVFKQRYTYYKTYLPGPRPTVIISMHFTGDRSISDWAARHFAKKGYNAAIINTRESLTDENRPLDKLSDLFIREAITGRMCVDLLETFPEVDKEKLYAFGISMGGIRTALLFGVELRIKKAGEISGGGDIPGIITDTHFFPPERTRNERMKAEGISSLEEFRAYMEKAMTVDPLDFGRLRNPEDFIMVISHDDQFVPDAYQEKLYNAFSKPKEGRYGRYPAVIHSTLGHLHTAMHYARYIDRFIVFFEGE